MQKNIMLVEDDEKYANKLVKAITKEGHKVTYLDSPVKAVAEFMKDNYDLVISDFCMKEIDGLKMLTIFKEIKPNLRSIILTAYPEEEVELEAIDMSVDHYLSKDKSLLITIKYIDDLLRKEINIKEAQEDKLISKLENIILDLQRRTVYQNNQLVALTKKEFDLLTLFLQNKGKALSREFIAEQVWTNDIEDIDLRVIDGHIKRLRAKLALFCISSVRGYGYKWNE